MKNHPFSRMNALAYPLISQLLSSDRFPSLVQKCSSYKKNKIIEQISNEVLKEIRVTFEQDKELQTLCKISKYPEAYQNPEHFYTHDTYKAVQSAFERYKTEKSANKQQYCALI